MNDQKMWVVFYTEHEKGTSNESYILFREASAIIKKLESENNPFEFANELEGFFSEEWIRCKEMLLENESTSCLAHDGCWDFNLMEIQ